MIHFSVSSNTLLSLLLVGYLLNKSEEAYSKSGSHAAGLPGVGALSAENLADW
jgi:hypothetical protein